LVKERAKVKALSYYYSFNLWGQLEDIDCLNENVGRITHDAFEDLLNSKEAVMGIQDASFQDLTFLSLVLSGEMNYV
jgi:hypothetical protein